MLSKNMPIIGYIIYIKIVSTINNISYHCGMITPAWKERRLSDILKLKLFIFVA